MELINAKRKAIKELLWQQKEIQVHIRGNSMEPLLDDGEKIMIVPANEVDEGDIVLWARENGATFLIHRIIAISEGMYITKGDNLEKFDYPIAYEDIIGLYNPQEKELDALYRLEAKRHKKEALRILQVYKGTRKNE